MKAEERMGGIVSSNLSVSKHCSYHITYYICVRENVYCSYESVGMFIISEGTSMHTCFT